MNILYSKEIYQWLTHITWGFIRSMYTTYITCFSIICNRNRFCHTDNFPVYGHTCDPFHPTNSMLPAQCALSDCRTYCKHRLPCCRSGPHALPDFRHGHNRNTLSDQMHQSQQLHFRWYSYTAPPVIQIIKYL